MKKFFWMVCMFPLLQACTTIQTISFDRLQAADFNFPEQIQSVGVVNCMPLVEVDSLGTKHSSGLLEGDGKISTETLAQEIAATNYFDRVVICDSALWKHPLPMEGYLASSVVDSLLQALDVDILLAMERVHIQLADGAMTIPGLMATIPAVDGVVTPVLRSYVSGREVPLFAYTKSDTLCWEKTSSLNLGQIVKEASEYAATMPMQSLLPHWVETERVYFDGGNVEMRDAGVCLRENDWDDAADLWKQVYESKKGKVKMRAAFNLALYSEMQNDYQQAVKYLEDALMCVGEESPEGSLIRLYRQQLELFLKENQRLQIQMKRFE